MVAENRDFLVVNAFARAPFGGNPAAVFTDASGLDDDLMQAIARQLNLVETVFVFGGSDGADFELRYFTPDGEIPIAGHPTIATWLGLLHRKMINVKERTKYSQKNRAGIQEIEITQELSGSLVVTMKQPVPRFLDYLCTREQVADLFEINEEDIDSSLPIRAVDTGLGHLIVPIRSLDALFRVKRNIEPLKQLCQAVGVREAQLFCFEAINKSADMHTRNICPREGLEDPACGVGNGALSAYLSRYVWTEKAEFNLNIEQGNIVQMPSFIRTRTLRRDDAFEIFVGGAGVVMLEGQFLI